MKYIVHLSGGISSFLAAKRLSDAGEQFECVFADTLIEDQDTYRFLIACAGWIYAQPAQSLEAAALSLPGVECNELEHAKQLAVLRVATHARIPGLHWIADGRTPWQVYANCRLLGNSRMDPCSRVLKRELLDKWTAKHCPNAINVFGYHHEERERADRLLARFEAQGKRAAFPLLDQPWIYPADINGILAGIGIAPPRMYAMGYPHGNCGGQCSKAGQAAWRITLREFPNRYAYAERKEQELRDMLGNVSMLTDRKGDGKKKPLPLTVLRERVQSGLLWDESDWGACSCFTDTE